MACAPNVRGISAGAPYACSRLRRVGETCLWWLVISVAAVGALQIAARLRLIVLPIMLAVVLATFLAPMVQWLKLRLARRTGCDHRAHRRMRAIVTLNRVGHRSTRPGNGVALPMGG
jgi:hypothetical protein